MTHFHISGRIARDITLRYTKNGKAVATLTIASRNRFKQDDGADFISCTAWGKLADIAAKHLVKGQTVDVEGVIADTVYTNPEGTRIHNIALYATEIEFFSKPLSTTDGNTEATAEDAQPSSFGSTMLPDDEIPF